MVWGKGQSGNPGGRKPMSVEQRKAIAMLHELTPVAINRLRELIGGDDAKVAASACKIVLDKTVPAAVVENPFGLPEDILRKSRAEQIAYLQTMKAEASAACDALESQLATERGEVQ